MGRSTRYSTRGPSLVKASMILMPPDPASTLPIRSRTLIMSRSMSGDVRQFARQVIQTEADAVRAMAQAVDDAAFDQAVRLIVDCPGAVLTCGIGKAGHIARKLAATFASTGTPSHFLS